MRQIQMLQTQMRQIQMRQAQTLMNKPVYLGLSILDLSKTVI